MSAHVCCLQKVGPLVVSVHDGASTIPTSAESEERIAPQVKLVIAVLLSAAFLMILNETVMGVALPPLMAEFGISAATAQWLTTAYLLTMAVIIPTTGVILQRFPTRTIFLTAISFFVVGTGLAGVAPLFPVLVAARVIQAIGTAVMLPLLMTTVLTFVPVSRRGRTMGMISVVIAVAPAVGPTFSGFAMHVLSWRWIFFIVAPIAVLSLLLGVFLLKNITEPRPVRFDLLSVTLSALTFGGLIYGLSSIGESVQGGALIDPWIPLLLGGVMLVLFVWRQVRLQRHDGALLDLRTFGSKPFVVGVLMLIISMAALFGSLILMPIYLQDVLLLDTLQTGLIMLPGGLIMGLVAPFVGRLFDRFGPRPIVIPGAFGLATAMAMMFFLNQSSPVALVVVILIAIMTSLGFLMTPLMTSALGSLTTHLYSHGSAIMSTMQQLAGAAGTALGITVMTAVTAAQLRAGVDETAALAEGIHLAFLAGAILALIGAALSFFVRRPPNDSVKHA